ncbi:LamG-like jellyroll fold domain-containing protein [Nitrosopumilus sp.]|uniref:LamG-like jellyroll fold domain-containing protein n=1 Tax=Nitrosopumilus sp. TaxID=2024843 RepID=UPI00349FE988
MRKHRGLSAVVGTVFLAAIMVGALTYVSYSMDLMGQMSEMLIVSETMQRDQMNEAFEIQSVERDIAGKLDGVISNSGEIPLEIKSIYIEEDGVLETSKKFDVNTTISPGDQADLGSLVDFDLDETKGYEFKVVSTRGMVKTFYINSIGSQSLYLNMKAIPETVSTDFVTTLLLIVTNNSTNNAPILNLTPEEPTVDLSDCSVTGCTSVKVRGPTPTSYPNLKPGETATFSWDYTVSGNDGDVIVFESSLLGGLDSNTASSAVTIKEVVSALSSGTSLSSLGLEELVESDDLLIFHSETVDVPSPGYQLSPTSAERTGITLKLSETVPRFFTNNSTSAIDIPDGQWTIYSKIMHENLPDSLMYNDDNDDRSVDMIFHFTTSDNVQNDSTGNTNGFDKDGTNPTFHSSGSHDGSSYFSFDGNDRFTSIFDLDNDSCPGPDSDCEDYADIEGADDSTSLWFRVPIPYDSNSRNVLISWNDNDYDYHDAEFYQIQMGDGSTSGNRGKIIFSYDGSGNGDPSGPTSDNAAVCPSNSRLDDGEWHHVVAVRDGSDDCKLYIDGVLQSTEIEASGNLNVDLDGVNTEINIGFNGSGEYFEGDLDDIMHWNDHALSQPQVTDLYNANFGDDASVIDIFIYETDVDGNYVEPAIISMTDVSIPFQDSFNLLESDDYDTDSLYLNYVFSDTTIVPIIIDAQNLLHVTLVYKNGLDTLVRIDDETMSNPKSTYLQFPIPSEQFQAFFTYDNDEILKIIAQNTGDVGAWFTYQGTRAIFENLSVGPSYAGIVCSANSTDIGDECDTGGGNTWRIDEDRDSIFVDKGEVMNLYFFEIQDRPDRNFSGGNKIVAGDYHMYVFISGYDETGQSFLRKIDIGKITVTD